MADAGARTLPAPQVSRLYYGWVVLGLAALAMLGTLPGRTQGLGLITEPLIRDLGVTIAMRPEAETIRRVFSAQMGKAGPPMNGKDLHFGDMLYGIWPAIAPLGTGPVTIAGLIFMASDGLSVRRLSGLTGAAREAETHHLETGSDEVPVLRPSGR